MARRIAGGLWVVNAGGRGWLSSGQWCRINAFRVGVQIMRAIIAGLIFGALLFVGQDQARAANAATPSQVVKPEPMPAGVRRTKGQMVVDLPPYHACPCGNGYNCVGPKGGRYCIAPSGKKRYQ